MESNKIRYNRIKNKRSYTDSDFKNSKVCVSCNETKSNLEFHKKPALKDGFDRKCKTCRSIIAAEYEKSPECRMNRKEYYYNRNYKMSFKDVENA